MKRLESFVAAVEAEFPSDRVTYQKGIPTFHPESAEEGSRLFRLANRHRQKLFITGFGNNIDPIGEPFEGIMTIRTDRLNQMLQVVPADLYIVVGSGYPLREINHVLEEEKLWFPHGSLPYVGSVGGALAVGLSSDFAGHDFPLKKYFIQAEVVTPQGEIIKPGSACFKSVSGYDVVKLFAGSWGLLGLIVSATFRVMPDSGAEEYAGIKQKAVGREALLRSLDQSNPATDAVYSRKLKAKFDPSGILPIV